MPSEEHKRIFPSTPIVAGAILAVGFILAGWVLGAQIKAIRLGDRYVAVRGLAERTVKSDLAIWNISFRSSGNDFQTVLAQSTAQKQTVLAFLKAQGVPQGEITVGPPNVIDREALEFGSVQGKQSRYILTQSIVVTSPDVDLIADANQKVGTLLKQGVILAGSPGVSGSRLTYEFTSLNAITPDMITEATKNARIAAERFAENSGSKVGAIRQASQGSFSITAADSGGSSGYSPNNNPNASIMKTVRVVTNVQYYISN